MTREELITLMDHFLVGSRRLPLAISQGANCLQLLIGDFHFIPSLAVAF